MEPFFVYQCVSVFCILIFGHIPPCGYKQVKFSQSH